LGRNSVPQPLHSKKNQQASAGIVSSFAARQFGQVISDWPVINS
jgi:hypothetical protein